MTRNRTVQKQDVLLLVHAHDLQVTDGDRVVAHAARHPLAGEDAARRLALTDRTHVAVHLVDTVRATRALPRHAVPLDHALEASALAPAGHVHVLAHLEDRDVVRAADVQIPPRDLLDAEDQDPELGLATDRLEDTQLRLVEEALALLPEAEHEVDLPFPIAHGLLAQDHVRPRLDHRDRDLVALLREDGGHADLDAEKALSTNLATHLLLLERFRVFRNVQRWNPPHRLRRGKPRTIAAPARRVNSRDGGDERSKRMTRRKQLPPAVGADGSPMEVRPESDRGRWLRAS